MGRNRGMKFVERYGVVGATIYRGDPDNLKIPPAGHPLYDPTAPTTFDPFRVEAIDRDGNMNDPIEVWTDPDKRVLWVLDGRGRKLDVSEVNRLRKERGDEPVMPLIVPFDGTEDEAVARVREKNYHRRVPKLSDMAVDLQIFRKRGFPWEKCAKAMHVETDDAEQWGRKLLPLAFCISEVRAAIDVGEIPRTAARKFGGGAPDGSQALGKNEQLALLARMGIEKTQKSSGGQKLLPGKSRERLRAALSNGETEKLKGEEALAAEVAAATLAFIEGDKKALKNWPKVEAIAAKALEELPRGPKPKVKAEKR